MEKNNQEESVLNNNKLNENLNKVQNNVNEDGSVNIPEALRPYMGGIDKLFPKK